MPSMFNFTSSSLINTATADAHQMREIARYGNPSCYNYSAIGLGSRLNAQTGLTRLTMHLDVKFSLEFGSHKCEKGLAPIQRG